MTKVPEWPLAHAYGDADGALLCPICGDMYVWPSAPRLVEEIDGYEKEGRASQTSMRQGALRIAMECETQRHPFWLNVGMHKGQTMLFTSERTDVERVGDTERGPQYLVRFPQVS